MIKRRFLSGPSGCWLVGNLPEFGRDALGFFTRCAREYGDVVGLRLGRWQPGSTIRTSCSRPKMKMERTRPPVLEDGSDIRTVQQLLEHALVVP